MNAERSRRRRCAVYTRKSSEEGLEQAFNSLDAQREACEAYIKSQAGEGWQLVRTHYDDGGISGGTMERPALLQLLADIKARKIDIVVVYKVDRLTRSLADFAKIVEVFDGHGVSFVSVTQQFNTTTSMGRLTLNMLLSFAQFEREVTGERIRDKIAASKKKGMWMGGFVPLGYEAKDRTLVINEAEAETVRTVYRLYLKRGNVRRVKDEADRLGLKTKVRRTESCRMHGGRPLSRGYIYQLLGNPLYAGRIVHKDDTYNGQHKPIIDSETWEAIQTKLAGNVHERRVGARTATPSLLAGLLYDEHGNRLTPSHTVKNGIRYRYYVSQAAPQHHDGGTRSVIRIPAREIEDLVCGRVLRLLQDPNVVIDEIGEGLMARDQKRLLTAAKKQASQWQQSSTSAQREFLIAVVSRVTVTADEIRIGLRRDDLQRVLLGDIAARPGSEAVKQALGPPDKLNELSLSVQARLKRCSGEARLVIPPGHVKEQEAQINASLVKAIARAYRWKDELFSGAAPSIRAIARREKMTGRYVSRIIRLAFLAPDIVEAILDGYQPRDLDIEKLRKNMPISWADQRQMLGFATAA